MALVAVVGVVLAVVLVSRPDPGQPTAGPTSTTSTTPTASDEDQIDDQVAAFARAWNDEDFDAISLVVCVDLQADPEFTERDFLDSRRDSGTLRLTATDYDIRGDRAVVTIRQDGQSTNDFDFVREDGEWKWCEL